MIDYMCVRRIKEGETRNNEANNVLASNYQTLMWLENTVNNAYKKMKRNG